HSDPEQALELIGKYFPDAPAWPQLPKLGLKENMCPQFSQGMPDLLLDLEEKKISFLIGENLMTEMEAFYMKVIEDDLDYFALTPDYALGFGALINYLRQRERFPYIKGCVTGPITFGLTITDQDRKPSLYYPELFDAMTKTIAMKARWQVKQLDPFCDKVIIFIDEPYLSSVGSALISLKVDEVIEKLNEVITGIHQEGALAGIHCCANTDWSILMRTKVDIISFDAFGYAKNLLLYTDWIRGYFDRGGVLAWGITPSTDDIDEEDSSSLWKRMMVSWGKLEAAGFTRRELIERSLITPSCGMGTVTVEQCEKIMRVNLEISEKVKALK
ncbi:MAG: hypothetical protein U9N73_13085, partial [Candidatus Auribacterota bacterium]|nr:hypothetical protein [Candidatus Auribacterota bacterium]